MNQTQILRRAWKILWSYRTLWIFGIILALTSVSPRSNNVNYQLSSEDFNNGRPFITPPADVAKEFERMVDTLEAYLTPERLHSLVGIAIALICLLLLVAVVFRIANYVSRVALIRMVDRYETTEQKVSWKQGFRLGWSRPAWKLFLIDLVIYVPLVLVFVALFGCAALPLATSMLAGEEPGAVSLVTMIGALFLVIFAVFIITLLLSLVMELIRRECVLKESGAVDSIRQGLLLLRRQFKDVFLMWLILLGISIVFIVAMIPVIILFLGIGALVGAGMGYLAYTIWGVAGDVTTILTAIAVGLAFFFPIIVIPLAFLGGLRETYISTAWTLTYRELNLLESVTAEIPSPAEPAPET